jgi:antitoxin (DNA-binding transcriptional repressor) of toxin-antitoxin stability system
LAELVQAARHGEEVVIESEGQPPVQLVLVKPVRPKRVFGQYRDMIWMSPDFDDPLPDEFWLGAKP